MRKLFFWLHLSAGVLAGVVIFIMSVTGVLLMYEKQMISWFDLKSLPPVQSGPRLPVEKLLGQALTSRGSLPSAIALGSDPSAPALLTFGREIVYQDASNGQLLGTGDLSVRQFFRVVTDWHRWLATSNENRATGRAATGAANLAFLFIVLSGAYLWIPRIWTAASIRAVAWFRGGLSGKARDFNWHNVIGIWCFAPLVLIVASGSIISYLWASNLVYTLAGSPPPVAPERKGEAKGTRREGGGAEKGIASGDRANRSSLPDEPRPRPEGGSGGARSEGLELSGLDELWRRAAAHTTGWRVLTMRLPNSNHAPVAFMIDQGYAGQPQKRITLTLDRQSGAITNTEAYSDFNQGRQIRTWLRFVHTGEFYGIPGQTLAGAASAGAAVLSFTGIALSLRRLSAWRSRKKRARQTVPEAQTLS